MLTEPLDPQKHNRSRFDCGNSAINNYLRLQARQDQDKGISKTHILSDPNEPSFIMGYFSLSVSHISTNKLSPELAKSFGNRALLPTFFLARLGVDLACSGKGLGKALVEEAIQNVIQSPFGGIGLLLDVLEDKDTEKRIAFYKKLGFIELPKGENGIQMFLSIKSMQ